MEQFLPSNIGLKSGFLRGIVVDENGKTRPFSSVIICADNVAMQGLKNNQNLSDSLTLLRGSQGILFPKAGCYTVHIEINYDVNGEEMTLFASTNVTITPALDALHARTARKIFATPDLAVLLIFGGDYLPKGLTVLKYALKNPVLAPHFTYFEAKRWSRRFFQREPNMEKARTFISHQMIMSTAEREKMQNLNLNHIKK